MGPFLASMVLEALAHVMSVYEERQAVALVVLARAVSASAHHRAIGLVRVVSANPVVKILQCREYRRAIAVAHLAWAGPRAALVALVVLADCRLAGNSARSRCVVSARYKSVPANGLHEIAGPALATLAVHRPDLSATSAVKPLRARDSQAGPAEIGRAHFETQPMSPPPRIRAPQDKLFVR